MDPGLAVAALGQVLDQRARRCVAVADVDWAAVRARRSRGAAQPAARRGARGAAAVAAAAAGPAPDAGPDWRGQLAGLAAAEQERVLAGLVRAQAAAVLGHAGGGGAGGPGVP